MGEIADMMLDGTMDSETGEWNFDGEDGPGWPMTGAEAAAYRRGFRPRTGWKDGALPWDGRTAYRLPKRTRKRLEKFGDVEARDFYHWQIRQSGKVLVDWWPHKHKFKFRDKTWRGDVEDLIKALGSAP